jgi:hypothetical protein
MKNFIQTLCTILLALGANSFAEQMTQSKDLSKQEKIVLSNALIKTVDQTIADLREEVTEKEVKEIEKKIEEQLNRNVEREAKIGGLKILGGAGSLATGIWILKNGSRHPASGFVVLGLAGSTLGLTIDGLIDIGEAKKENVMAKLTTLRSQLANKKRELENAEAAKRAINSLADMNSEKTNH